MSFDSYLLEYRIYEGKYNNKSDTLERFDINDFLYQGIFEAYSDISKENTGTVNEDLHLKIKGSYESKKYSIGIVQSYNTIKNNSADKSTLLRKPAPPPFKIESLQPIEFQINDAMNNGAEPVIINTYDKFVNKKIGMEAASYGVGLIIAYQNNTVLDSINYANPYEISKKFNQKVNSDYVFQIVYGLTNMYIIVTNHKNNLVDPSYIYQYLIQTYKIGLNKILSYKIAASYLIGISLAYTFRNSKNLDMLIIEENQNLYLNGDNFKDLKKESLKIALSMHKLIKSFRENQTFALLCTGIPNWD